MRKVYKDLTCCLPRDYPGRFAQEVGCFGQGDQDSSSIGGEEINAEGSTGPKRRFPGKHCNPGRASIFYSKILLKPLREVL